jgi:hypothetical protein
MLKAMDSLTNFLRVMVSVVVLVLVLGGAWLGYTTYYQRELTIQEQSAKLQSLQRDIELRNQELVRKNQEINKLHTALRLLKLDRRVAHLSVLDQWTDEAGQIKTRVQFVEVDADGRPVETPRPIVVHGDVVYVDYWVAKFEDEHVEQGVPLKNTSICLFRSLFGQNQSPASGTRLDEEGVQPPVYRRGEETSPLERDIWANFWDYANDRNKAKAVGLRAVHGEAVSIQVRPGMKYRIQLRASDGLSILSEDRP